MPKNILRPQVLIEFLLNVLTPFLLSRFFHFSPTQTILVVIGTTLIDADHLLFYFVTHKTMRGVIKYLSHEFSLHRPHFFPFHTFEFLALSVSLSYLLHSFMYYVFLGFVINFTLDIITYLFVFKSIKHVLPYFFLFHRLDIYLAKRSN